MWQPLKKTGYNIYKIQIFQLILNVDSIVCIARTVNSVCMILSTQVDFDAGTLDCLMKNVSAELSSAET